MSSPARCVSWSSTAAGCHPTPGASWFVSTVPDQAMSAERTMSAEAPLSAAPDRRAGPSRSAAQVGDFHRAYGLPVRDVPTAEVGAKQVALRLALIQEEVGELAEAARAGDLIGVADALADIVYVAYGTAHVYGID